MWIPARSEKTWKMLLCFSVVGLALTEVLRLPCNPKGYYLEEALGMAILATRQATGFGNI